MKKLSWIFAIAGMAFVLSAHAQDRINQQAPSPYSTTDPLIVIYRISGVTDSGGDGGSGSAASFHCTNTSTTPERLQFQLRDFDGTILFTITVGLKPFQTYTASTHSTVMFTEDVFLTPGIPINQGFAKISSTSRNMFCSAMLVDAGAAVPAGIALHVVRSNAPSGVQE